ncbi:hypothetical protein M9H77_21641 [Catharanthus roseus]|uniref:Uncharacterized protein n=1 Tax=Catharanthus roseus TaxID=4058 RepID=A0ACC0ASA6_CATRO|nr:hypothetical protein M9H77_21641 [Catharanthus roseus]
MNTVVVPPENNKKKKTVVVSIEFSEEFYRSQKEIRSFWCLVPAIFHQRRRRHSKPPKLLSRLTGTIEFRESGTDSLKENKANGDNLFVRGRVDWREPSSHCSKSKGRSKSRDKNRVKCRAGPAGKQPNPLESSQRFYINVTRLITRATILNSGIRVYALLTEIKRNLFWI